MTIHSIDDTLFSWKLCIYISKKSIKVLTTKKEELQLSLFGNTEENKKQQKLDSVLDGLNEKYGYNFVKRAGKMNVDKKIFDNFRKKF